MPRVQKKPHQIRSKVCKTRTDFEHFLFSVWDAPDPEPTYYRRTVYLRTSKNSPLQAEITALPRHEGMKLHTTIINFFTYGTHIGTHYMTQHEAPDMESGYKTFNISRPINRNTRDLYHGQVIQYNTMRYFLQRTTRTHESYVLLAPIPWEKSMDIKFVNLKESELAHKAMKESYDLFANTRWIANVLNETQVYLQKAHMDKKPTYTIDSTALLDERIAIILDHIQEAKAQMNLIQMPELSL